MKAGKHAPELFEESLDTQDRVSKQKANLLSVLPLTAVSPASWAARALSERLNESAERAQHPHSHSLHKMQ